MKIEVGKTYELANGVVRECTKMFGNDPCAVNSSGYGPFVVDGSCYHQNGTHGSGCCPSLNVIRCVEDDTPTLWSDMTPEEKGALLLAHHEGKAIEKNNIRHGWISYQGSFCTDDAYRIKPEPTVETVTLDGWVEHQKWWTGNRYPGKNYSITFNTIDGKPDPATIKMEEL